MRDIALIGIAAALSIQDGQLRQTPPAPKPRPGKAPPLPTTEPRREDYPSRQAYRAALRYWQSKGD